MTQGKRRIGLSLRAKMLGILAGAGIFALIATSVLIYAVRQADQNLARATVAQHNMELLMLLSGRISDYGLAALEAVQSGSAGNQLLEAGHRRVDALFTEIGASIGRQVGLLGSDDERNATATKSLTIARLKARFGSLHSQVGQSAASAESDDAKTNAVRGALGAFGLSFAPVFSQALEDERTEARRARADMSSLRDRVIVFALVWAVTGLVVAGMLYLLAGRSILRRIAETVSGATAIASGELDRRLTVSGRDELALLMARFNRMAASFSRKQAGLLAAQSELAETVASRTADLRDANRRLEEIDENRRRFFADISHELRTPLTVILGEAELTLKQGGDVSAEATSKSMTAIQARAKMLRRRVDDMLRVARSESGQLDLRLEENDVNAIVVEALEDAAPFGRKKRVQIEAETDPDPLMCICDSEWLRQAVSGILNNAIKYSQPGSTVRVRSQKAHKSAVVTVCDTGYGISQADLPRIFDRFHRGDDTERQQEGGYGIGLSLVKWIVDEHNGSIVAKSPAAEGETAAVGAEPGTIVTVALPLRLSERT